MRARILISFHHTSTWDLDKLIAQANVRVQPDLWADSGAFSAMTLGSEISLEGYADWLHRYHHLLSAACTLDVIGDPVGTMRNTERLVELGCDVLPVYHMRSDRWDIFDHICDTYGHACLGGMAGTGTPPKLQVRFMVHAMRRARDRGSNIVWHTLGQTSDTVLNNLAIYSSDCSTWAAARRWGYLQLFDPNRQTMVDVAIRNAAQLGAAGPLLRDHGMLDAPRFVREGAPWPVIDGLAAVAFVKREAWVRRRIGAVHRPDQPDAEPGLRLYMSVGSSSDQAVNLMRGADLVDDPFAPARPLPRDLEWRDISGGRKPRMHRSMA